MSFLIEHGPTLVLSLVLYWTIVGAAYIVRGIYGD